MLAGVLLAGVVLAIVGGVLLLHTPPARRWVLHRAAEALAADDIRLEASEIDYNLLRLRLVLRGVTVAARSRPDLPPLLRAAAVRADLSLNKLLHGAYHVGSAAVESPQVRLVIDAGGRNNLPRMRERPRGGPAPEYFIGELRIGGASLFVEDRARQLSLAIPSWRLSIDGDPATRIHRAALETLRTGEFSFAGRAVELRALAAAARFGSGFFELQRFDLAAPDLRLALSGGVKNLAAPRLDAVLDGGLDLAALARLAGVKVRMEGGLRLRFTIAGPPSAPRIAGTIGGGALRFEDFEQIDLNADLAYDTAAGRVELHSLRLRSPDADAAVRGGLFLVSGTARSWLEARAGRVDLGRLSRTLGLPFRLASRAAVTAAASFPGLAFEKAAGRAEAVLSPLESTPAKDVLPVSGAIRASLERGRASFAIDGLEAMGGRAQGEWEVSSGGALSGSLTAAVALERALPALNALQGRTDSGLPPVSGEARLAAELSGTIAGPRAAATLSAVHLKAGTLDGVSLAARAAYQPGEVRVDDLTLRWRGAVLAARGAAALTGARTLNLQAAVESAPLRDLLEAAGPGAAPAGGVLSARAAVTGTLSEPAAALSLSATDLSVYSQPLGTLKADLTFSGRTVKLERLRLEKERGQFLEASGSADLAARTFAAAARAENLQLRSIRIPTRPSDAPSGRTVREDREVALDLDLSAAAAGFWGNPDAKLRLKAHDVRVAGESFGELHLEADLAGRRACFEAGAPQFRLKAAGEVSAAAPYRFSARLQADGTELPAPLQGQVFATAAVSGDAANPLDAAVTARIEPLDLIFEGRPLKSEGPVTAAYAGRRVTIEPVSLNYRGSMLRIHGSFPVEETAAPGVVSVGGTIDLSQLAGLARGTELQASGTAELHGALRGTPKRVDPELALAVSDASLSVPGAGAFTGIGLRAQIHDGALSAKLAASFASGRIDASATIPLGLLPEDLPVEIPRANGPARIALEAAGIRPGALETAYKEVDGAVSLRLEAEAPRLELDALRATARFTQLELRIGEAPLRQEGAAAISLRNGVLRVEDFALTGPGASLRVSGSAGLGKGGRIEAAAGGNFDAALLTAFAKNVAADGPVRLHVAMTGTVEKPGVDGYVEVSGANLSLAQPRLSAEDVNARLNLRGDRVEVARLDGLLNGGALSGGGFLQFTGGGIGAVDLSARASDVYLESPAGLKTLSGGEIRLRSAGDGIVAGGRIEIAEGSYTDPITLERGLLRGLPSSKTEPEAGGGANPLFKKLRFDVSIGTRSPLVIDNNLARAGLNLDLRLVGAASRPGLTGRITLDEGGELYLSERRYYIERGVATFTNERRIEPAFDILARTSVKEYGVTLLIQGGGEEPVTATLSSEPALPENDIIALLLTGRTLTEAQAEGTEVAQEQVLSLLAGSLTGNVTSQIQRVTGLSQVRVDPSLIASEQNPTARLTLGQDITRDLSFVYSMDLTNSSKQVYIAEFDITRRFVTRGTKQEDNSYRFEFNHSLLFGGSREETRERERRIQRIVSRVRLLGDSPFSESALADQFGVKAGSRYDFFRVRKGLDRLRQLHAGSDLLESRVRLDRRDADGATALDVRLEAGPEVEFVYEGWPVPGGTRSRVRDIWRSGVFDGQRLDEASAAVREALVKAGYLRARVETSVATSGAEAKRVLFDIAPGPRFHGVRVVFEGAHSISAGELRGAIRRAKLEPQVFTDPGKVAAMLTRYYRDRAFLDAEAGQPAVELDERTGTGRVVFPVREGVQYRVGEVRISGNRAMKAEEALAAARLETGAVFLPGLRGDAQARLEEAYAEKGYLEAEAACSVSKRPRAGLADVEFHVEEKRPSVVESVNVSGNRNTSESLIRTQTELAAGDPLSFSGLSRSRRNLYQTGAYSLVDLEREVLNPEGGGPKQVRLNVRVREIRPWQIRYGAYYDTERGPGGIADVSVRNLLGSARAAGFRTRYDSDLREARAYFSQPLLRRFPVETTASTYYRRELQETFINDRLGVSLQQQMRFGQHYVLNYGYRLERSHTFDREPDPLFPFDVTLRVAPLSVSLSRETRDEILDASRGSFSSHALEWAAEPLGSQLRFVRYFGQYFKYLPLARPREIPWTKAYKPRLVYAGGVRLGLAAGLGGQELVPSERFFAGGGTSIRGFGQNFAGPLDFLGEPEGGEAVFIANNELRFPVYSIFDGVGFADLGNVYRKVSDFRLADLRKTGGFGLRVRTPYFLLRLDYGIKLDRRPGESFGQLFFSIGQAF